MIIKKRGQEPRGRKLPSRKFISRPSRLETQICTSYYNKYHCTNICSCHNGLCQGALQKLMAWTLKYRTLWAMQLINMQCHEFTSLIPTHRRPVTMRTRIAAHGSTTTSSPGICWRARKEGRLSPPPKSRAWNRNAQKKQKKRES